MCADDKKTKSTTEVTTTWLGRVHYASILPHNRCVVALKLCQHDTQKIMLIRRRLKTIERHFG